MKLRMVWLGFCAVGALAACGDDTGGAGGSGGGATTGASTTGATTTGSNTTTSTGGGGDATTTTTTTTTTTGSGGGTTTGSGGGTAYDCASYCTTITDACTGDNLQYPDEAACLASCTAFPVGEFQDADSTLGCRAYHAGAAASDPVLHCPHAGPLGTGACGSDPCEGFCAIAQEVCTGDLAQYADVDTCLKVCASFAEGDYSVSSPSNGDDLACRMYHLSVAAQTPNNTDLHCPHMAAVSDTCN